MFWRIISALGVLFWAVMAGLLIRDTYFPEESRFAEVPPKFVLDLFLGQKGMATTLLLYRDQEKLGHSTFTVRKQPSIDGQPAVYDLQASGIIEGRMFGPGGADLSWRLVGELGEGQQWRSVIFQTGWRPGEGPVATREGVAATVSWKDGGGAPVIEVRKGGKVVMDGGAVDSLLKGGALPLGGLLGTTGSRGATLSTLAHTEAREGAMVLAGKKRKCYVLHMQFAGLYDIKMLFTEAGELARVDLPQGLHLLEPTIHGLGAQLAP